MTAVDLSPAAVGDPATPRAWVAVCRLEDLVRERGAAALVDGEQVALFRLHDDEVLAVQQRDPFTGSHVLSRGIVGGRGGVPTVASPLHKQVFDLRTGACLDPGGDDAPRLRTWPVRLENGTVLVGVLVGVVGAVGSAPAPGVAP
ncbi:nitrite reductase small subunit NirD [Actinotalea sp. AC32]|nr:nitrite reductase small subunit NirD [Actinotalea sp. AC32]